MKDCYERLLELVYGIDDKDERVRIINENLHICGDSTFTLEEIAKLLGITRERVRQIEASAIKKLKHPKVGRMIKRLNNDSY